VRIDRQDNGIRVVVVDDGRGAGRSGVTDRDGSTDRDGADGRDGLAGGAGGHGLVGLRERTAMFGGSLDAGPVPGGGFEVEARFPLDRRWS
jgi:signal transduction histidine kinase